MNKPVIPEAAVEAVTKAYVGPGDTAWDDPTPMVRRIRIQKMQKALEAAAPHLLIAAWDEGYTVGNAHNGRRDANPYRNEA